MKESMTTLLILDFSKTGASINYSSGYTSFAQCFFILHLTYSIHNLVVEHFVKKWKTFQMKHFKNKYTICTKRDSICLFDIRI